MKRIAGFVGCIVAFIFNLSNPCQSVVFIRKQFHILHSTWVGPDTHSRIFITTSIFYFTKRRFFNSHISGLGDTFVLSLFYRLLDLKISQIMLEKERNISDDTPSCLFITSQDTCTIYRPSVV